MSNGTFDYSNTVQLDMNSVPNPIGLELYPNPAEDILTISISYREPASLRIINAIGQEIYSGSPDPDQQQQELQVLVTDWPAGAYRALVNGPTLRVAKQFIVR